MAKENKMKYDEQKYPLQNERSKFITLFVNFYNNKICVLRERLNWDMPFEDFAQWTSKVELEVNNHDFKSALITLKEIEAPLLTAGYLMEFIRVSEHIYSKIDWNVAIIEEYSYFIDLLKTYITILTELGETVKANDLLTKFSKTIQGKGENYISYCEVSCYYYWFIGDFDNAIKWGERIIELKKDENGKNIINTLALAWRDSKRPENINKALDYFLEGEKLDDVLNPDILKRIGRREDGKLILVTTINPTFDGEGKTTMTIGLAQALSILGKKTITFNLSF